MRRIIVVWSALLVCLGASNASAGRIFGDIMLDGKAAPARITATIAVAPPASDPGAKPAILADSVVTDKLGSYKLMVKEAGKCSLTLVYGKQAPTLQVFSYKDAMRYDRLASGQRCSVVLNGISDQSADITLVLFPGAYASLKEKPYDKEKPYCNEVIRSILHANKRLAC